MAEPSTYGRGDNDDEEEEEVDDSVRRIRTSLHYHQHQRCTGL